jgi:hypothetical protein
MIDNPDPSAATALRACCGYVDRVSAELRILRLVGGRNTYHVPRLTECFAGLVNRPLIRCSKRLAGLQVCMVETAAAVPSASNRCLSARLRPSSTLRKPNPISNLPLLKHQNMTPSNFTNRPDQTSPPLLPPHIPALLFLPQPPLPASANNSPTSSNPHATSPPSFQFTGPTHFSASPTHSSSLLQLPHHLPQTTTPHRPNSPNHPQNPRNTTSDCHLTTRIKIYHMTKSRKQHTRVFWIF